MPASVEALLPNPSSFELMKTLSAVSAMEFSALRGHSPRRKVKRLEENGLIPLLRVCH